MLTHDEIEVIQVLARATEFKSGVALSHYQVEGLIEAWERLAAIVEIANGRVHHSVVKKEAR